MHFYILFKIIFSNQISYDQDKINVFIFVVFFIALFLINYKNICAKNKINNKKLQVEKKTTHKL